MKVSWKSPSVKPALLYFGDLKVGDSFRNANGHGAVYTKVELTKGINAVAREAMLEVATGKIFPPTHSPVELVDVSVNINLNKPQLYN